MSPEEEAVEDEGSEHDAQEGQLPLLELLFFFFCSVMEHPINVDDGGKGEGVGTDGNHQSSSSVRAANRDSCVSILSICLSISARLAFISLS